MHLPSWVISGSPDAARQILTAIAAAVITVVLRGAMEGERAARTRARSSVHAR